MQTSINLANLHVSPFNMRAEKKVPSLKRVAEISANILPTEREKGILTPLIDDGDNPPKPDASRFASLRATLAAFNQWPKGNDPYDEHDFGAFDLFGERLFFKIDYYHPDHDTLALVPSSIELCRRVLTIMLADEY